MVGALPEDYAALAERERLGYERVSEAVAERFHMDEDFLIALNSGAAFAEGEEVVVVQPGPPRTGTVARDRGGRGGSAPARLRDGRRHNRQLPRRRGLGREPLAQRHARGRGHRLGCQLHLRSGT